jgi:acetate kinase
LIVAVALVLALNAGSSSLKFAVYEDTDEQQLVLKGSVSGLRDEPLLKVASPDGGAAVATRVGDAPMAGRAALRHVLDVLQSRSLASGIDLVGHRIVHGGQSFVAPKPLDPPTLEALRRLIPLAPLHQPFTLEVVAAASEALPNALHVGSFDTAFHALQPRLARLYGLPRALTEDGVIGYGFHGLSYAYIATVLERRYGPSGGGRVIVAHLGSGVSLCALSQGRSVATTMGFSPLDGPPMGTRCGSLDPGVVLYLLRERGLSADALSEILYEHSGWLGISQVSADMATLLESADPRAREAIDLFVYRVGREIGSLAAALGGIDRLVFTAGIGEHSPAIRARICEHAAWLGVVLNPSENGIAEHVISSDRSAVEVMVIPTDEERMIAAGARACRNGS